MFKKSIISISKNILFILIISLISICLVISAYAEDARGVTDSTIKIGGIADHTGPIATICKPLIEAFKNYTQYINDKGGINGRKLTLIMEDDRYSIPTGISAFKKLIFKDKALALLGPVSIGETKALYNQIKKNKVTCVPVVPDESALKPFRRYIFLPVDLYDDEIAVVFTYIMKDLKHKNPRIGFVTADRESGKVVKAAAIKWAKIYNVKLYIEILPTSAMEATSQVLSLRRNKIDCLIVHYAIPVTARLLKDLVKYGLRVPVFGTFPNSTEDTIRIAGNASKNFIGAHSFSSWYDESSGMKRVREITLKYHPGTEKPYRSKNYTVGWTMATILYEGIKRAGNNLNTESLVRGLESIKNLDTKGICGPITYSSTNHKGVEFCKLFRADPASGKLLPITKWRKAPNAEIAAR